MSQSTWSSVHLSPIHLTWGAIIRGRLHRCPTCQTILLTGEKAGFCCGPKGKHFKDVPSLPPLPEEYSKIISHPDISPLSRVLNLIFSLASLETTHPFPHLNGPSAFFAVQGKIYHRLQPNHTNSALRWLLYDGFLRKKYPFKEWASRLPPEWIKIVRKVLKRHNPLFKSIKSLGRQLLRIPTASLLLQDSGTDEIAAIISYDNTTTQGFRTHCLRISMTNDHIQYIPIMSRLWEPLAYPLLFPHGTLGWGLFGTENVVDIGDHDRIDPSAACTQMWYYRQRVLREDRFQIFGRLANEYIVDMFTRNIESRLNYFQMNQDRVRKEDALLMDVDDVPETENVYLPASFLGSNRWVSEQVNDCLAIAAAFGPPTFFITMTCDPQWPEIQSELRAGQDYTDIPCVVARVFHRKINLLCQTLKTLFPNAGQLLYLICSIEFQKRGLPHAHLLVKYSKDCITPADIDCVIQAELPSEPSDHALVMKYMIHKHPPDHKPPSAYCQTTSAAGIRKCRFNYPREVQERTTIDNHSRVTYRRRNTESSMVVPFNLELLCCFRCHINFEAANSSHIFQYLFKYIHKGPDKTRYSLRTNDDKQIIDEIAEYWHARYLTACEATWRLLGFHISRKEPSVTPLPIALSTQKKMLYENKKKENSQSLLEHYFLRPTGAFQIDNVIRNFDDVLYAEYYTLFRLAKFSSAKEHLPHYFEEQPSSAGTACNTHVILRRATNLHLSHIQAVHPSKGELFYLRTILKHKPIRSYANAKTVDGVQYGSFQEAAQKLGLFSDENEAMYALREAIETLRTPFQIRLLFVHLLVNDCIVSPIEIWEKFQETMSVDFSLRLNNNASLAMTHCLQQISSHLEEHGKSLEDYGLPEPNSYSVEVEHELLRWNGDEQALYRRSQVAYKELFDEQRAIYDVVIDYIINEKPLTLYINGKAGRGKTHLVKALCDHVRSLQRIVLATATSAFAAHLYPGGRTTHSMFKIPVNEKNQMLQSPVQQDQPRGQLIQQASLIVWDEAPMVNKAVLHAVHETCCRCMGNDLPFGGKVIILLGDFRQTAPVIQGGTRNQVIDASIKSSPLWPNFTKMALTTPIRNASDPEFAEFVDSIGDGLKEHVPLDLLRSTTSIDDIIDFVYPQHTLECPAEVKHRAILAPTNRQVDIYNTRILNRLPGESRSYIASDTLKEAEDNDLEQTSGILDYVARHSPHGMPSHTIQFKINAVFRLLRNFSVDLGLVKNARVVITNMGNHLITVRLLQHDSSQTYSDEGDILIPRISFTSELPSGHTLLRRQFPLSPSYATTFNSCQGLTLNTAAIDLTYNVFSHGQLYTALSRVKHRDDLLIRIADDTQPVLNVTFPELLQ